MEANKCFGRRRVEEECPRSASEKTSPLTARCAVSKGSARATASSAICAGKSITKSLPSAKRRSVKPPAKEAIRTETQKPVSRQAFLFAQNLSFRFAYASQYFVALRQPSGHVRLCALPSQSRAFLALLATARRNVMGFTRFSRKGAAKRRDFEGDTIVRGYAARQWFLHSFRPFLGLPYYRTGENSPSSVTLSTKRKVQKAKARFCLLQEIICAAFTLSKLSRRFATIWGRFPKSVVFGRAVKLLKTLCLQKRLAFQCIFTRQVFYLNIFLFVYNPLLPLL